MSLFFTMFLAKLTAIVAWFAALAVALFVASWDMFRDVPAWIVEQFLTLAGAAVGSLDVSGITSNLSAWGSIPANVLEVCSALGLGTAFAIIVSAIGVRFALQLVPFTRLGS